MGLSEVGKRKQDMAFVKYELTEVKSLVGTVSQENGESDQEEFS